MSQIQTKLIFKKIRNFPRKEIKDHWNPISCIILCWTGNMESWFNNLSSTVLGCRAKYRNAHSRVLVISILFYNKGRQPIEL